MEALRNGLEEEHENSNESSCSDRDSDEAVQQLQNKSKDANVKINNVLAINPGSLIDTQAMSKQKINKVKARDDQKAQAEEAADQAKKERDSKVGKVMQVSTMKSVIILVLSMLFSASILDLHLYLFLPNSYKVGLKALTSCYGNAVAFDATFKAYLQTND